MIQCYDSAMSHAKPQPLWTIAELGAAAQHALAVGYDGQRNGQVREIPDARTIRYYASLGLIDPPAEMRGRTAYYGRRHLLQLVAVKRLQAAGKSLVEVQNTLVGMSAPALEKLARVPADAGPPPPDSASAPPSMPAPEPSSSPRDATFWATPPAPVAPVRTLQVVPLSSGVSLLLETAHPPTAVDLAALRAAAEPLLQLLENAGISVSRSNPDPNQEDS